VIRSASSNVHPLLRITDLTVEYRPHSLFRCNLDKSYIAVNQVSFEILKGETLALVGESGSGKTSIAMSVLGFVKPTGGQVEFDGLVVNETSLRNLRIRLQPLFQDSGAALNPQMPVGRAIGDGLPSGLSRALQKKRIMDLMRQVGLDEKLYRAYPRQLSGGQKQRVCLARALAVGAELLILDEPFSAQDIFYQMQLMLLLRDLKLSHNLTYLLISHDLASVRLLSDRIVVMLKGKVVEAGPTAQIFSNPQNDYTRELIHQAGIDI